MERMNYPSSLGDEKWYIFPSHYWSSDVQSTVTEELNDRDNYETFNKKLENLVVN
jgi:hypothetical protein